MRVEAGDKIGIIADLDAEAKKYRYPAGVGSHLHLGVVESHMTDEQGVLHTEYRGGDWGRLKYTSDPSTAQTAARIQTARRKARGESRSNPTRAKARARAEV